MQINHRSYDITIIGSGIVGAAVASALAKNTQLQIAVLESKTPSFKWQSEQYDSRVSAIALSSKHFFENINVWESIAAKRISPYQNMQVWDAAGNGEIDFAATALQEEALGYIIEDNVMRVSLLEKFKDYKNLDYLYSLKIISLQEKSDHILLETDKQQIIKTKLLIAADGAESWVRNQAGIELKTWDYRHYRMAQQRANVFCQQGL
jgi:2-octaprenylphenol hydroxylase